MNPEGAGAGAGIYLDWNGTTPLHPEVTRAMARAGEQAWGNPASVHGVGRRARAVVEDAREAIAELAAAEPRDVVFTAGATEANNLALCDAPALVTSRIEHPSVVRVAEAVERQGRHVRWLPVPASGRIDPEDVRRAVAGLGEGFVVALMAANHETGVIQPVTEVAALVHASGGRLHVDAAQAAGKVPGQSWQSGDTTSLAAHKLRGPKGIGALVARGSPKPRPLLVGGSQERGVRPGTVDPVGAAGFGAAARRALAGGPARYAALEPLRDRLERAMSELALVNGEGPRLPHVANLSFHGVTGDELVAALDLEGIFVSSGSACSAGTAERSPVLSAMLGSNRARAAIRFSLGDGTSSAEVDQAISTLIHVLTRRGSIR